MIRLEENDINESNTKKENDIQLERVIQNEPERLKSAENPAQPMTRAEYVRYARMQCEKELSYFPWPTSVEETAKANMMQTEQPKQREEEVFQPFSSFHSLDSINKAEEEQEEIKAESEKESIYESDDDCEEEYLDAISINKLLRKEKEEKINTDALAEPEITEIIEEKLERTKVSSSAEQLGKLSYMTKFTIRLITAIILALAIITIDYFGIGSSQINSESIKTTISKNDTIDSIEEAVSTFAREKVIPVFSGSDEQK